MSELDPVDIAPLWLWKGTAASAFLAVLSVAVVPPALEWLTLGLVCLAAFGTVALLYGWGQYRDTDSDSGDDDRREQEMKAEAGGYGGNGGL